MIHVHIIVTVDIFAHVYICLYISRRALDAQKIDVSENYNHNRKNRNKWHIVFIFYFFIMSAASWLLVCCNYTLCYLLVNISTILESCV